MNVFHEFPQLLRDLGITPKHLVHVGAHKGEEMPWYREAGVPRITLVEPIPRLAAELRENFPDVEVVECACSEAPGQSVFNVFAIDNLSTMGVPDPRDTVVEQLIVPVRRLDEVAPDANIAVIDAQGFELEVLRSAPHGALDLIIAESCTIPEKMAVSYDDLVATARSFGFEPRGHWVRSRDYIDKWARGKAGHVPTGAEIRDVWFTPITPPKRTRSRTKRG